MTSFLDSQLAAYLPSETEMNEFKRQHAVAGVGYLRKLAKYYNAAVVGIMHQAKNKDTRHAIPGHPQWQGRVETAHMVYWEQSMQCLPKAIQAAILAEQKNTTIYFHVKKQISNRRSL